MSLSPAYHVVVPPDLMGTQDDNKRAREKHGTAMQGVTVQEFDPLPRST